MTTGTIVLHPGPSAGFEAPFDMLEACHQRVVRMLTLLDRLAAHVAEQGADLPAQQAARDVMRYFDQAGPAHHEDEERHVLPRLRAQGRADLADRLHADHETMRHAWSAVRADLQRVAAGCLPDGDAAPRWRDYAALYEQHLRSEEAMAYPAVRAALAPGDEETMGREMAARRGLRPA
jgi:hemerythrin-like domain-containing protein